MATDTDIAIEPAEAADTGAIVRMVAALAEHEKDPAVRFDAAAATRDLFTDPPFLSAHVARFDGAAIGVAIWHDAYETSLAERGSYIISLWVDPQFRRRGIAMRLVSAVADATRQLGGTFVWWASKPWNQRAHATYASLQAKHEPIMAHALTGDNFQNLANRHRREPQQT